MKIKFTGDFKDLKPMGFKFHKLFARNYKVYERDKVWVGVHEGGYVEIDDHYGNSGYIAKMIIDGTYPVYTENRDYKIFTIEKGKPRPCTINKETGEIFDTMQLMRNVGGHDKWIEMVDRDDYRDVSLLHCTMELIKELADKGMIKVEK